MNTARPAGKVRHPIYLSPELSRSLRVAAAEEGRTKSDLVEEVLAGRRRPLNSNPRVDQKAKTK